MRRITIQCSTNPFLEIEVEPEGIQVEFQGVDNSILTELIFTGSDNIHLVNIPPSTVTTLFFDDSGAILTKWGDKFKDFFPNLQSLKVIGDEVSELPELPGSLTYLEATSCELETWPEVKEGLRTLILASNVLEEAGDIPNSLDKLDITDNLIERFETDRNLITLAVDAIEYLKLDGVIVNLRIEGDDLGNLLMHEPCHIQRLQMDAKLFTRIEDTSLEFYTGLTELWLFNFFNKETVGVDLRPLPKLTTLYATPQVAFIPCQTLQYVNGSSLKSRPTGESKPTKITKANYHYPDVIHFD